MIKISKMTSEIKDIFSKQTIYSHDLELESKSLDHELELKKEEVKSKKIDNQSKTIDIILFHCIH